MNADRRRLFVLVPLAAGLLVGMAVALYGWIGPDGRSDRLPEHAVARVGDDVITRAEYQRALASVAADKRDPLTAADRRRILERLVDEALLVRHGRELYPVPQSATSPRARRAAAALADVRAEADARGFDDAEVREFYEQHTARFRGPDLLHVRALRVADREHAEAALAAWRGDVPFAELQAEYGGDGVPVPDGPLPADKLRDYLGPAPVAVAAALDEGEIGGPVPVAGGHVVIELVTRRAAQPPPFAEVEEAVRHEMRRRSMEALLAERLAELRERYRVVIADDLE